jgi:hypothetical protein
MSGRGMFWAVIFSIPLWLVAVGLGLLIHAAYQ